MDIGRIDAVNLNQNPKILLSGIKIKLIQMYLNRKSRNIFFLEVGRPKLPDWAERLNEYSGGLEVVTNGHLTEIPVTHHFTSRWIFSLRNVTIEPERGDVYSPRGQLIVESSNWHPYFPNPLRHRKSNRKILSTPDSPYIVLASWAYFHFLIENLPLFLAAKNDFPHANVLIARNSPHYLRDALDLLKIIPIEVDYQVTVDKLVMCSVGRDTGWAHPKDISLVKAQFQPYIKEKVTGKSIYVARSRSMRSPLNEKDLIDSISALGVEVIYAEELSLQEQISRFSSCDLLIGVHGAGLSNQVWMQSGTTVIEILDKQYFNICFEVLAKVKGIIYESVIFDSKSSDSGIPVSEVLKKITLIQTT